MYVHIRKLFYRGMLVYSLGREEVCTVAEDYFQCNAVSVHGGHFGVDAC